MIENIEKIDIGWFHIINSLAGESPTWDVVGIVLAQMSPYIFCLFILYLGFTGKFEDGKTAVLISIETVLLGLLINVVISLLYYHPRPFMLGIGTQLISHASETSFPSDHATFMFAIACALCGIPSVRGFGVFMLCFALLGGVARVYCGVHWPLDILGSLLIAIFAASAVSVLSKQGPLRRFNDVCVEFFKRNSFKLGFRAICEDMKFHIKLCALILRDPRTPRTPKIILGLAVAYALSPMDLIPDFIPVLGQLDDAIIVPLLIFIAFKFIPSEVIEDCRKKIVNKVQL